MDLKIKDEQLTKLQALVNQISQTQMELGQVESFDLIAAIPAFRKDLEVFQKELEEEYGKVTINVHDGTIKQEEDGADKKD
jgi:predicted amino acid-binding ACT domain protein